MGSRVAGKIKLQSVDELLGVPEIAGTQEIELGRIHSFPNHPFKVLDDEKMDTLVESIRENGILNPVIVRPDQNGDYEMISGHRRLHAAGIVGLKKVPAIVKEMSDDEVKKIHTNKNNINNTELSNTESNLIVSGNDGMRREIEAYSEIIRENIEIDILRERYPYEKELIDGIYDLILETVLCKNDVIIVASNRYPAELVRSKFLKLNSSHIEYAIDCFKSNTTKVRNIKKYLLTTLFNAPSTISGYYQAEVNHDFPQYAVIDK